MNREVHYDLTRDWALDEGFAPQDATAIARANWDCDVTRTGARYWRYHWPLAGAPLLAWGRYRRAVRARDLVALGEALHATQDTIAHGVVGHVWHWQGIDRWEHRSPKVQARLERWSRRLLRGYRRATDEAAT